MAAQILSMFSFARPKVLDWSQQELAEFYRVENALVQAGMRIEIDRGITDEGDPWFVFCRQEDGEVIIHFARLDGKYLVSSPAYSDMAAGEDFGQLVRDLVSHHPLVHSGKRNSSDRTNVFLHPTALLIALVATAFFKTGEASAHDASENLQPGDEGKKAWVGGSLPLLGGAPTVSVKLDASHVALVISAAIFSLTQSEANVAEPNSSSTVAHVLETDFLQADDSGHVSTVVVSAVFDGDDASDAFHISSVSAISQGDVLTLLSTVALLTDLPVNGSFVANDRSGASLADFSRSDEGTGTRLDGSIVSHEKSPVILELVKGSADYPTIMTWETAHGDKIDGHELATALPQILQPFLTASVHLVSNQTSDGILLSLSVYQPQSDAGAPEHIVSTPAVSTVQQAASPPTGDLPDLSGPVPWDRAAVISFIEKFIDHTPDYKFLTVDHEAIFYDPHAIAVGDLSVKSITWDFSDVSISLVAPSSNFPPELHVA